MSSPAARSLKVGLIAAAVFFVAPMAAAQDPGEAQVAPSATMPAGAAPAPAPAPAPTYVVPEGCVLGKDAAGSPLIYCPRPTDAPVVAAGAPRREWYGWQTLIVDGASVGIMIIGGLAQSAAIGATGGLVYLGGPAAVHFGHGNVGMGFASMGLRVGAPIVGALIGLAAGAGACSSRSGNGDCLAVGASLGFLGGYVTAVAVDAAVLAYDEPKREAPKSGSGEPPAVASAAPRKAAPAVQWTPTAAATPQGASVGVAGTF
jgi:hypothetical protein